MSAQGKFLRRAEGNVWIHRCPACGVNHSIPVGRGWTFNGDLDRPTFSPSIRITSTRARNAQELVHPVSYTACHYLIAGGIIFFCADSLRMANQSVPLPDFEAPDV